MIADVLGVALLAVSAWGIGSTITASAIGTWERWRGRVDDALR